MPPEGFFAFEHYSGSYVEGRVVTDEIFTGTQHGDIAVHAGPQAEATLSGGGGEDSLYGGLGADLLQGGDDNDLLEGGDGDDTLEAGWGDDTLDGGAGNDLIDTGGGRGRNLARGGAGEDTLLSDHSFDTLYGDGGDDSIDGGSGMDVIYGGAGNDMLIGNSDRWPVNDHDSIFGGDGDDKLVGSGGDDTMHGGAGRDVFVLGERDGFNGHDEILDFTVGEDALDVSDIAPFGDVEYEILDDGLLLHLSRISSVLLRGIESTGFDDGNFLYAQNLTEPVAIGHGDADDDLIQGSAAGDLIAGRDGNDTIEAGAGDDVAKGGDGADLIDGGTGDDRLFGGDGRDTLISGGGADTLSGGRDLDLFVLQPDGAPVVIDHINDRLDRIQFEGGLTASSKIVVEIDRTAGDSATIHLDGRLVATVMDYDRDWLSNANFPDLAADPAMLLTLNGSDYLNKGAAGADTIIGSDRSEIIQGNNSNDLLFGGGHSDRLDGGIDDDVLFGGDGNDRIEGGALDGNDQLFGDAGEDTLNGGDGADRMTGGTGADLFVIDSTAGGPDLIDDFSAAEDRIDLNALTSSVSELTITDGTDGAIISIGGLAVANLTGIAAAELTIDLFDGIIDDRPPAGTDSDDSLTGTAADDELFGGLGDDTIVDTFGDNALYGGEGDDILRGGSGADTMVGGAGADTMMGGGGRDVYVYDSVGDGPDAIGDFNPGEDLIDLSALATVFSDLVIVSDPGDTVISLHGTEIVQLMGVENGAIKASMFPGLLDDTPTFSGTDGADFMAGTPGSDEIFGGLGNDTLSGSAGGSDLLYGGDGIDFADYSGQSNNVIHNRIHLARGETQTELRGNVFEEDGLVGIEGVIGSRNDDHITGDDGDNILFGGAGGMDGLFGGAGDDTLGGDGFDTRIFGGEGADIFQASGHHGSTIQVLDFEDGIDRIDLSGLHDVSLDRLEITQNGSRVDITLIDPNIGQTRVARIGDATVDQFTEDDFIF